MLDIQTFKIIMSSTTLITINLIVKK